MFFIFISFIGYLGYIAVRKLPKSFEDSKKKEIIGMFFILSNYLSCIYNIKFNYSIEKN